MLMKLSFSMLFVFFLSISVFAQKDDLTLGRTEKFVTAAVYDLSDPLGVNIEVNLWGFVKYPGRYIIPVNSTLLDLISFSGGPSENSNLEEIRLLRPQNDSTLQKSLLIKLNYDDLLWNEKIRLDNKSNPTLQPGDVILILEEKRFTFRDNVMFFLPILTSIITVATFIVTVTKK